MNKKILIFLVSVCLGSITLTGAAQEVKCDSIYELAEQMPVYGTGPKDFFKYLNKNLDVKKPCKPTELKRIIFTVNKDGKISDIEVVGVNEKCKEDLIKQLKTFPDWTPGKNMGQPVCVRVVLPIQMKEKSTVD
jgi:protein TonB